MVCIALWLPMSGEKYHWSLNHYVYVRQEAFLIKQSLDENYWILYTMS